MKRTFRRIMEKDAKVLDRHLSQRPVKLGALANDLGVSIKVSSLGTGISGQISNEDGKYVIRVNRNEARERQRFTIGHELAHFLLHRDIIDRSPNGIRDTVLYRSGEPQQIEFEANQLAAEIVMPTELVEKELECDFEGTLTEATIEALANRYEVSKAAMEIKLSSFVPA